MSCETLTKDAVNNAIRNKGLIFQKNNNLTQEEIFAQLEQVHNLHDKKDEKYYIVTDRWQTFTNVELNTDILEKLSGYCDEFLVHGVDVEGKASGIEEELIKILEQAEIPVTYAGGIGSLDDLERIREIGNGKIDFTIGSALDLFGGQIPYDVIKNYR